MGTMILISTVAIIVALVGSAVIWRLDIARADEIERPTAPAPKAASPAIESPRSARPVPLPVSPPTAA
ncbi:MAG: hypothetical protein LH477_04130 [Nocardioides sp.]|nr:hypothetical protein [Nocardioides sp.]